jgi:isoaspartyl peptidase/L-asparaginase-like protein (Ntn-hydrolase superfamily)
MPVTPVYIATWKFGVEACEVGLRALMNGSSALDAVEAGANAVEENPAVNSVGFGGLPNAEGVVELDAAIMDGATHSAGAVAAITGIRKPISVARRVMESTPHVMLAGQNARRFALQEGFPQADLTTPESLDRWRRWKSEQTAPDVAHFDDENPRPRAWSEAGGSLEQNSHDTVGVCALDAAGNLAAGCTTSGIAWKRPGRVGDSPLIGSGLYVDNEVGAAAATGNGDEMMKVCLSYRVISLMEEGRGPQEACEEAIRYLLRKRPRHQTRGAACIALAKDGRIGAAATRDGFRSPDRLWHYAYSEGGSVRLAEGIYVAGD